MKSIKFYCGKKYYSLIGIMVLFAMFVNAQTFVQINEDTYTSIKRAGQLKRITLFKGEIYSLSTTDSIMFGAFGQIALSKNKFTTLPDSLSKFFALNAPSWQMTMQDDQVYFDCSRLEKELGVFNASSIRIALFNEIKKGAVSTNSLQGYFRVIAKGYPSWVGRVEDVRQQGSEVLIPGIVKSDSSLSSQLTLNTDKSTSTNNELSKHPIKPKHSNHFLSLVQSVISILSLLALFFIIWFILNNKSYQRSDLHNLFEQQAQLSLQVDQLMDITNHLSHEKKQPKVSVAKKERKKPATITTFSTTDYANRLCDYLSYLELNIERCFSILNDADRLTSGGDEAIKLRQILSKYIQNTQSNSSRWRHITEIYAFHNYVLDTNLHKEIFGLQLEVDKMRWVNKQIRQNYLDELISHVFILLEEVRNLINFLPSNGSVDQKFCTQLKSEFKLLIDQLQQKTQSSLGFQIKYVPLGVRKNLYAELIEASDCIDPSPLFEEMMRRTSSQKDLFIIEIIQYAMSDSSDYTKIKVA